MKLPVILKRDETGMIVAECPAIPGCVSQGRNDDEAIANIREAIVAWLEVRAEQGLPLTVRTVEVERSRCLTCRSSRARRRDVHSSAWGGSLADGQPHDPDEVWQYCLAVDHRELAPGTLRKLIRLAGLSVEQFRGAVG
jgi:predicted RNase H-like HicB family nuclease